MSVLPKNSFLYLLIFGLFLAFTSCDNEIAQDAISPDFVTEEELPDLLIESLPPAPDADPSLRDRRPCFRFVYPIEIQLRNGTVITADDAEELRAAHRRIVSTGARANFVYPFQVELANGTTVAIQNFLTLRRLHRACRDLDDENLTPCITINYPIQVTVGDSLLTVDSAVELLRINRAFRPRVVSIVYPIEVTRTGSDRVISVDGARELARLRRLCHDRGDYDDRGVSCYRLLFPVSLTVNGVDVTVVSRLGWRFAVRNLSDEAEVSIVFPVTLINRESREETVVASYEEWEAARELCD